MTTWNEVREKAAEPGSRVLTTWLAERAERETQRVVSNFGNGATQSTAGSDSRVVELLLGGGYQSAAGIHITPESGTRVSAVYACTARIGGAVASMNAKIYKRVPGGREEIVDHPFWYLLNEEPTARFTSASMWELAIANMLLRESGYCYISRTRSGAVQELIPLKWEAVNPRRVEQGRAGRLRYDVQDVNTFGADQDDILHFPNFGFDGLRAVSTLQHAARNAAGNAAAMDEYAGRFFRGGAHHSIVLEAEKKMSEDGITNLQTAFANKYSGLENAHRMPLVLTEGITAKPITISAEDAQLLEARKFQVTDIARAFGVPPHLIGDASGSTSWGSGLEEQNRAFLQYTLSQHLQRMEQELNRKLFRRSGMYLEFDRETWMEANSKAQGDYFRAAMGGPGTGPGWMSPDEARQRKNLPPLKGEYARVYMPPVATATLPKEPTE
ncbi:MAG: phage portal protein [Comamonadaceae bacterium]|nr:MAG: phage portal protein [Comamonadaceae bacterium]